MFRPDPGSLYPLINNPPLINPFCLLPSRCLALFIKSGLDKDPSCGFGANPQKKDAESTRVRDRVFLFCDEPSSGRGAQIWSIFIVVVIFGSCVVFTLSTQPELMEEPWVEVFFIAETFCVMVFTLEYLVRFTVSKIKLKFIFNLMNVIDLLSVAPW